MRTHLQILSEEERHQIHERSLKVLATAGVQVSTPLGRRMLAEAGAQVDQATGIVRFPRALVEESLRLAPKKFSLGARRPEWDLEMNIGECSLLPDGEAVSVIDRQSGEQRPCNFQDWLEATIITDYLEEVGLFWSMVNSGEGGGTLPELMNYWISIFRNFSKHVQLTVYETAAAPWLMEILQVIFGDQDTIRRTHPISFLLCPQSPLILDRQHTEAYLSLSGWDIPVACMPMPLMGATAPGTMVSTIIQGNCETLALLCLVQAAAPGTPFIYAPVFAAMNPYTGMYSGGAIENGLLGAACSEMARYYGLPVEASGGGTDHYIPDAQAAYETSLNSILPVLSWPDILVGPGLLGSSMILSLEKLIIDVEIFRMGAHAQRGILTSSEYWLDDVICRVGPGGNYLGERSTVKALRSGEIYIQELGTHEPLNSWLLDGWDSLLDEARDRVEHILATHRPLPLSAQVEQELARIEQKFTARLAAES